MRLLSEMRFCLSIYILSIPAFSLSLVQEDATIGQQLAAAHWLQPFFSGFTGLETFLHQGWGGDLGLDCINLSVTRPPAKK